MDENGPFGASFPWSFRKYQGKPQKHQRFFSPYEPLETLENKQKAPKKTKDFRNKTNTKETQTSRKRRTGPKWRFWVGSKKFMLKKSVCFFPSLSARSHVGLPAESPRRVSRIMQTLFCTFLGVEELTRSSLKGT